MTLGELQAWVLRTIKRPEKAVEVVDAINAAIELASTQGDFAFDLVEGTKAIDGTLYAQNIVISTSFPRFRKIKYLRPSGYSRYVTWRDSSRIFQDGKENVDVWYRSGDNVVFKLSNLQTEMLYGYYAYPARLTSTNGTNGYTDMMSAAIHDLACGRVYEDMGNAQEAARLEKRGMDLVLKHQRDKQDGVSRS